MRIVASLTPRRVAAHATIAVLVGTATAAGVAFAGSNGGRPELAEQKAKLDAEIKKDPGAAAGHP
jgi:hypothetical protein